MDEYFVGDNEIILLMQKDEEEIYFKIILNDSFEEIGHIIYTYKTSELTGNLSYFIYEEYRNNGYAKKALYMLVKNIRKLDNKDLYLSIVPSNIASIKVAKYAGAAYYKPVNIPTNYIFCDDSLYNCANMYKIKNKE